MSTYPCEIAYNISSTTVAIFSVAAVTGIISFIIYFIQLHKNPNYKPVETKYDIESASWVLILSIISGMVSSIITIINHECGPTCPSSTLQCNNQIGISIIALVSSISIMSAGIMKLLSLYTQINHPINSNLQQKYDSIIPSHKN